MTRLRLLLSVLALAGAASPALAGPVTLKANPVDDDGRVTLGDVFDGVSGATAGVVIGQRAGPSIIFDAGGLQAQALRAGLRWDNPTGLSRVVVRAAEAAPATTPTSAAPTDAPRAAAAPTLRPAAAMRAIARNDMVQVAFESGGVKLTITGRALRNAGVGEPVAVLNLQSGRTIDAVAVGPGRAVTGPAAHLARTDPAAFAALYSR
jgi:flagella basal body P-ring formation protein FlgA